MRGMLLRTSKQPSKFGGDFFYFFFKGSDGKSYRSCVTPNCHNFHRWQKFIGKENVILNGLMVKTDNLIDADSFPVEEDES